MIRLLDLAARALDWLLNQLPEDFFEVDPWGKDDEQ